MQSRESPEPSSNWMGEILTVIKRKSACLHLSCPVLLLEQVEIGDAKSLIPGACNEECSPRLWTDFGKLEDATTSNMVRN